MDKEIIRGKMIDLYGQISMIVIPIIICFLTDSGQYLSIIPLALCSWQFISAMIHLRFRKDPWIAKSRRIYLITLAIAISVIIISITVAGIYNEAVGALIFCVGALLFIGLIMSIWYLSITTKELKNSRTTVIESWVDHIGETLQH